MLPVPVKRSGVNVSPRPCSAPPPLGTEMGPDFGIALPSPESADHLPSGRRGSVQRSRDGDWLREGLVFDGSVMLVRRTSKPRQGPSTSEEYGPGSRGLRCGLS